MMMREIVADARSLPGRRHASTKEEIAKMPVQELYDTFGTRYPKNSK
jgi:hypothetical protein